jgi:hypothetical protein
VHFRQFSLLRLRFSLRCHVAATAVVTPEGDAMCSKVIAKRIETNVAWIEGQALVVGTTGALVAFRRSMADA